MSKSIEVSYHCDTGPCDATCNIANTNGVHIDIDNGERGELHVMHVMFLCDKHAENLAVKILKKLGYDPEKLKYARC